ncbi:hypothetical protein HYDPIDRAFT_169443 [Hydnomerulius pinastri MD-312]|uniref:SPX domain-containing protein n=1 Tax=Hydnomerulius pinastri MD-312 TaxID=994086 RepID=A0A0C9W5A1_9AGAM|nr:hypothetical protein HYDPIDRAFT_169443 [Hydnomerulius pinastri MD-312]
MKFARYLQDTQTPEWKKAYIDYRGLKKQIGLIRAQQVETSSSTGTTDVDHTHKSSVDHEDEYERDLKVATRNEEVLAGVNLPKLPQGNTTSSRVPGPRGQRTDSPTVEATNSTAGGPPSPVRRRNSGRLRPSLSLKLATLPLPPRIHGTSSNAPSQQTPLPPRTPQAPPVFPFFRDTVHAKFFELLDAELDKIESFYAEREKEMRERGKRLREQLNELGIHRRKFYESTAHHSAPGWAKKAHLSLPAALLSLTQPDGHMNMDEADENDKNVIMASESGRGGRYGRDNPVALVSPITPNGRRSAEITGSRKKGKTAYTAAPEEPASEAQSISPKSDTTLSPNARDGSTTPPKKGSTTPPQKVANATKHALDPQEYQHAKKRLKKAVVEYYRGLEVLNNYRILNLTGFRKALKKYEKITRIPAQAAYMKEKVEPSAFASGAMVSTMLKEMEELFAARFERGDKKKAVNRLRVGSSSKSHHFSTFRSGIWLGLALPAVISGLYLLLPVLFALLVGLNVLVWARERINYVFIFGPPLIWPLVWLALVLVVMLNPIRSVMWGRARWWTLKNVAKLGASGIWTVEFTDFWLGLVYTLSNLYFIGCFYTRFFPSIPPLTSPSDALAPRGILDTLVSSAYDPSIQQAWETCGTSQNWGAYYILGVLPFIVRFVQSLRRYWDSKLPTHLINAGKYGMGMVYYFFYYYWRHQGNVDGGASYILWCFTATVYSIYACAWDFLMDWSICKPHARHPFLRPELVYTSQIPVTNLCIRFVWVFYIPTRGPSLTLRTFVAALLEMLRRVQWNVYRLENEHLGNMDQYRVTREVPLPYSFDTGHSNDDDDDEADGDVDGEGGGGGVGVGAAGAWLKKTLTRESRREG